MNKFLNVSGKIKASEAILQKKKYSAQTDNFVAIHIAVLALAQKKRYKLVYIFPISTSTGDLNFFFTICVSAPHMEFFFGIIILCFIFTM